MDFQHLYVHGTHIAQGLVSFDDVQRPACISGKELQFSTLEDSAEVDGDGEIRYNALSLTWGNTGLMRANARTMGPKERSVWRFEIAAWL